MRSTKGLLAAGALLAVASTAQAHINMVGELIDRGGDQKTFPCGGQSRSGSPYVFEPGATIVLQVNEAIPHDSYYRIAFDDDGTDDFVDPASIDPINPNRATAPLANLFGCQPASGSTECCAAPADGCGASDFCNVVSLNGGPSVLWDNLDPHVAGQGAAPRWAVKLPDIECENCTLQVIQVMQDVPGHGVFDGQSDMYYRCIDIQLKKGAGQSQGTTDEPIDNNGIDCIANAGGTSGGGTSGGSTDSGGTSSTGGNSSSSGATGATGADTSSNATTTGNTGSTTTTTSTGAGGGVSPDPTAGATGTTSTTGSPNTSTSTGISSNTDTTPYSPGGTADDNGCSAQVSADHHHGLWLFALGSWLVLASGRRRKR